MRKYTKSEKIEVLSDEKTEKISSYLQKTGKTSASELNEEDWEQLQLFDPDEVESNEQ